MRKAYQISNIRDMPSSMHIYEDEDALHDTFVLKEYIHHGKNKWQTISNDVQTQVTASHFLNSFNRLLTANNLKKLAYFKYVLLSIL